MMQPVYILGGAQTDFATNWTREGHQIFDLFAANVRDSLERCQLDANDLQVGHVGNFVAELFTGQGMLGGFYGHVDPSLSGMPATRHEGACASGSLAALAAMADIQSGRYDLACVTGIELMRNVPGTEAGDHLGAAVWVGVEATDKKYIWPAMFSQLAEEYDQRYGVKREHLAEIARINFANAKRNGNAQTRDWTLTDAHFGEDEELNPVIDGHIRRQDCAQITDGAATIFLASHEYATRYAKALGVPVDSLARIEGFGHTTAPMQLAAKMAASAYDDYVFPWVRKAITDAYTRAGISGPEQLDAIETHDCFTINEYMAIDHFGITKPGEAWKAIEAGRIAPDGDIPVNASGGLMGGGHPVGATGVRMLLDAAKQVTASAGDYQVAGAKRVATYNVGGSATTNCCFIVAGAGAGAGAAAGVSE
ncbi:MAG: acetyl-CoA acetyltransferase [Pseudomonadota bacterium]